MTKKERESNGQEGIELVSVSLCQCPRGSMDMSLSLFPSVNARVAQWIRRLPTEQENPSSSLGVGFVFFCPCFIEKLTVGVEREAGGRDLDLAAGVEADAHLAAFFVARQAHDGAALRHVRALGDLAALALDALPLVEPKLTAQRLADHGLDGLFGHFLLARPLLLDEEPVGSPGTELEFAL